MADSSMQWPPCCRICREPLTEPGALLFSPPNEGDECAKEHFCKRCYGWLAELISTHATRRWHPNPNLDCECGGKLHPRIVDKISCMVCDRCGQ
jgi:hypothetical protein